MRDSGFEPVHRRGFLGRVAAAGAVLAGVPSLLSASPRAAGAPSPAASPSPDAWLDKLTGKHRMFFDAPLHGEGLPQIHVFNYINTYREVYKAAPSDVNAVLSCYGAPGMPASIPLAWNDAMWAKYRVGELLGLKDASGKPMTRNAFWRPQKGDPVLFGGMVLPAGLENLTKLGATVLMCNNAFMAWMGWMESKGLGKAATIEQDIRANLNPGVVTVPAMVIAIEKAQGRGLAYDRQ